MPKRTIGFSLSSSTVLDLESGVVGIGLDLFDENHLEGEAYEQAIPCTWSNPSIPVLGFAQILEHLIDIWPQT